MMRRDMMRPAMRTSAKFPFASSYPSSDFPCRGRDVEACGGVGVDAQFPQCGQRLAAQLLLFAEFDCHILFLFCFYLY